ncbi:MAG TPA: alpha/beta fold hydrolase [Mycobacteriales bacterium]
MSAPAEAQRGIDLTGSLSRRLRHTPAGPLLSRREGAVLFLPDRGVPATVELHRGTFVPRRGRPVLAPTATVRGRAQVLADIIEGKDSGLRAFLEHEITVRGDLSLAMALDGLFDPGETPAQWPHAGLVTAAGVDTAYLDAGPRDGRPVLMLHGLGATNASLLPILWDLATDHRVIAPDLPGFGASEAPPSSYAPASFVPWAVDLCRQLGLDRPVILGNSMGGRIALEIAMERPPLASGIIGLCASPAFRRMRQLVPFVRLLRPEVARLPLRVPRRVVLNGARAMFSRPNRLPDAWYDAAADEFLRVFAIPDHRISLFAATRQIYLDEAFGLHGFWDLLPSLTPPALFLWGDRDRLVSPRFARHVSDCLPSSTSVVLDDCGHVPQFEQPDETARLCREFLAALP